MYEHAYYLCMCFTLLEMALAQSPIMLIGLGLGGILFTSGLCIWGGLELFGLAIIALYASVFLFLSVVALYLGSAWDVGGWTRWGSFFLALCVFLAGALLVYVFSLEGAWQGTEVVWQDYYALADGWGVSMVTLIHMFFMRFFAFEALLLNLYVLWGLIACLAILGLISSLGGGGFSYRSGKSRDGLSQTRRVATPMSSRRSWRRRNSSLVREIRWYTG